MKENKKALKQEAIIFDIQRYSIHDGHGIRTLLFLKGCPLRCIWCCNPESQISNIEMAFYPNNCIGCLKCIKNCPYGAIEIQNNELKNNWDICRENCFKSNFKLFPCTSECFSGARKIIGQKLTADQIINEIEKDELLYRLGGGVTVSGGEPMMQIDFLINFLSHCKERDYNTAIETSGHARLEDFEKILDLVDLIFFDIKHMDSKKHLKLTGVDNTQILKNAKALAKLSKLKKIKIVFRFPLIPKYNDDEENIRSTAKFIKEELKVKDLELLTFHQLGLGKYTAIGKNYLLTDLVTPKIEEIRQIKKIINSYHS